MFMIYRSCESKINSVKLQDKLFFVIRRLLMDKTLRKNIKIIKQTEEMDLLFFLKLEL